MYKTEKILVLKKYTREEIITSEIQKGNQKVSLPDDWAKWMLEENRKDKLEAQSSTLFADKADISLLDSKIEKLMNAYLETFALEEYRDMKTSIRESNSFSRRNYRLLEQKRIIGSNLPKSFEIQYGIGKTRVQIRFVPKSHSNFQMGSKCTFEPRGAWKTLWILDSAGNV